MAELTLDVARKILDAALAKGVEKKPVHPVESMVRSVAKRAISEAAECHRVRRRGGFDEQPCLFFDKVVQQP